jgi:hypothetical protein
VPEQQRRDDPRDQREDQVGLAEVAALEARRALDLADDHRADHADEHEHREQVDHEREPALVAQPREGGVAVHRADHRDHDGGEEDEEAPEDRRVDQPGHEPLEQLALGEDDLGLVASAPREVAGAIDRLAHPHEADEQAGTAREQGAAHRERGREGKRSGRDGYRAPPATGTSRRAPCAARP